MLHISTKIYLGMTNLGGSCVLRNYWREIAICFFSMTPLFVSVSFVESKFLVECSDGMVLFDCHLSFSKTC